VPVQHVRIARATNRLDDVVAFYRDILGLDVLSTFEDDVEKRVWVLVDLVV
jgi:catechol 2,3-dioxygenase-like lactoylglutathione lyase family enzyme